MKILVENSGHNLKNMGDIAMLQVAIKRLKTLWPEAEFYILTDDPEKLLDFLPNLYPLATSGSHLWHSEISTILRSFVLWLDQLSYRIKLYERLSEFEMYLKLNFRGLHQKFLKFKFRHFPDRLNNLLDFIDAFEQADLVIATGGGYITSYFEEFALEVINLLNLAIRLNKPTLLLGQGLGPLSPILQRVSENVLPKVDLISLREEKLGPQLLQALGVSSNRLLATGDDAIELAYNARSTELGYGIGINLRIAEYSNIDASVLPTVAKVLQNSAKRYSASLIPVPITHANYSGYETSDSAAIQNILKDCGYESDGGASLDSPLKIIQQVSHCRIVVTGSYHAGVFALSQGIPVIGLAKSQYYVDKFTGLANQFKVGCYVILLENELDEKLLEVIDSAWSNAENYREPLLQAAKQQIDLGYQAYQKAYELVQTKLKIQG